MLSEKRIFSEFEMQENLFERKYNGIPYWQYIRFFVCEGAYSSCMENEYLVQGKSKKKRAVLSILRYPMACLHAVWMFLSLKPCDVICFRNVLERNQRSKFFDTWKMPEQIKTLWMDAIINPDMLLCFNTYNIAVPHFFSQFKYYTKKLFGLQKRDEEEYAFLRRLEEMIILKFGKSISAEWMEQLIFRWIEINNTFEKYYENLFAKVKCRAIVVVCYYQNFLYSAYRVAKRNNIRVIEFQHGTIKNHEEYWFEDQRGMNNDVPDYFLTFGDAHISWTKLLPSTRPITVGFPFQEQQILKWNNLETENNTIIVYPQPEPEFEKVVDEFANLAVPMGFRIIVKVHPLQAADPAQYYPLLSKNKQIEIVSDQTKDIYFWLKLGKHHVMANTTVGLEAVAFDHTNICIAEHVSHLQTQPLLNWGIARGFSNAEELLNLVRCPIDADILEKREMLWKKNSVENIRFFFCKLQQQEWPTSSAFNA